MNSENIRILSQNPNFFEHFEFHANDNPFFTYGANKIFKKQITPRCLDAICVFWNFCLNDFFLELFKICIYKLTAGVLHTGDD